MGRPRKHHPSIPSHIDQSRIPAGIYWDASGNGRWFVHAQTGRVTVAGPKAKLSDLHAIAEAREEQSAPGSLDRLMEAFHESLPFSRLAPRTRTDYQRYRRQISAHKLADGSRLGMDQIRAMRPHGIRRLIDKIGAKYPTKANHWLRYLSRVFAWGIEYGHPGCTQNPCAGVSQLRERRRHQMPDRTVFRTLQEYARERGALPARARGSVAPYLAPAMEIAYQCRLRGIEVITLTDAQVTADALISNRRKGSRDNATLIGPALRAAITALQMRRDTIWKHLSRPVPMRPEARPLIVTERGDPLSRTAWDNSWQRLLKNAIEDGVIGPDQRFGLHGLKHRGVTDTEGDYQAKQFAAGHKTPAMTHVYDHEIPRVPATSDPSDLRKTPGIRQSDQQLTGAPSVIKKNVSD